MFGENQDCFAKGVVYDMTCITCDDEAKERNDAQAPVYRYTGTTSRSLHERGAEHLKAFKDGDQEKSVLLKHSLDKHEGNFVKFEMKVIKKHFSAFSRLIHECIRIERNSRDSSISSLNSKCEYKRGYLPRLIIDGSENGEAKVVVNSSLKDPDELKLNELKMKEKNDVTGTIDFSKDDPYKNPIFTFVDFNNFDVLPTAAETKPKDGGGGKVFYESRQKNNMTRHISFSKVRKRRRPS